MKTLFALISLLLLANIHIITSQSGEETDETDTTFTVTSFWTTSESSLPELDNGTLVVTAYTELAELYTDGILRSVPNGNNWNTPDYVALDNYTRLIAVRAINFGEVYCAGILASVEQNYLITSSKFKCTSSNPTNWEKLGFDDSSWNNAFEFGTNGNGHYYCNQQRGIANIDPNARWVWTNDLYGDMVASCRGYTPLCEVASPCLNNGVCLKNDVKLCNCPFPFTGEFCESVECGETTPCQNGGTCNANNNPLCTCRPQFTGVYCETELRHNLTITAKSTLYEVFIDASPVTLSHGNNVSYPDVISLQIYNQLIAVTAIDTTSTCAGILASVTDDILVTNAQWKCTTEPPPEWYTLGFDDVGWSDAYVIGPNHNVTWPEECSILKGIDSISANASWIWTPLIAEAPIYNDIIHCRAYLPTCNRPNICLNGGTCNINNNTLCTCQPGYTGVSCENELVRTLNITAKSVIYELYIDGVPQNLTHNDEWDTVDVITLSSRNRLVAILAADSSKTCAGILASITDDYLVTDSTWKCDVGPPPTWYLFGFDDSSWPSAYTIGPNGGVTSPEECETLTDIPSVSENANWIWTSTIQDTPFYDSVIHCRAYLPLCETAQPCQNGGTCNNNNATLCSCPDEFTGIYCESLI